MIEQIIFADDELGVRNCIGLLIRAMGYKVSIAENGEQAYNQFEEQKSRGINPLILTDLSMPIMDGVGLAKKIKEQPKYSKTTILALSGFTNNLAPQSREYFDDIIPKPITYAKLEQTLHRY